MPEQPIISGNSPVRITLVLGFLGVFASAVWWASGVSSNLKTILTSEVASANSIGEVRAANLVEERDISDLKLKSALNLQEIDSLKSWKSSTEKKP